MLISVSTVSNLFQNSSIVVTIATVKVKLSSDFYTKAIVLKTIRTNLKKTLIVCLQNGVVEGGLNARISLESAFALAHYIFCV